MSGSTTWDAERYMRFGAQRTRPAAELAARIGVSAPRSIVDLGCGPGNSTAVLRARWPEARIVGVDSSEEMIAKARADDPKGEWVQGDVTTFEDDAPYDVVFSNAVLHWLPDHASLVVRLFTLVAGGGALAFQIPCGRDAPFREHIREVASDPRWRDRTRSALTAITIEDPSLYYDALAADAFSVDIWTTEYEQIMENSDAIVDWITSTSLRPFLEVLDADERADFTAELRARMAASYPTRTDGRVLFPFRRLFVVATRRASIT